MRLNEHEFRDKVLGCWIGKNIGGTLGAPFEWMRQVNHVDFYVQELKGTPLPNDDLDIQLLWVAAMEQRGVEVTTEILAEYWCTYVTPHWAEYGTGKINMRSGLQPPLCGSFQNAFKHSNGAFIRSEIWACISPALPAVAARLACKDAILDHGDGEGTLAEIFMAALESAAFVQKDLFTLIDIGLSYIPADCGVALATRAAVACFREGKSWLETRETLLQQYRGAQPNTLPDERAKGYHEGVIGYDAPLNIAITVAALLYGGDDFGKVQCTAVNMGEDSDCTAATAGSVWGIIHGAKAIPQKWIEPIGRSIQTIVLNLGDIGGISKTVDDLTDRTLRLAKQNLLIHKAESFCTSEATDLADCSPEPLFAREGGKELLDRMRMPTFDFDLFTVSVDYGDAPTIQPGIPRKLSIHLAHARSLQANLSFHWYLPDGWTVTPSADAYRLALQPHWGGKPISLEFGFTSPKITKSMNRAVLEITIEGRPSVMLVPITLLNGSLAQPNG